MAVHPPGNIDSKWFEGQCECLPREMRISVDRSIEYKSAPLIAPSLLFFIAAAYRLPTVVELANVALGLYPDKTPGDQYTKETVARARSYFARPSLIRDFHLYYLLLESNLFDGVIYATDSDFQGIDLVVQHGDDELLLQVHMNSKRAKKMYAEHKSREDVHVLVPEDGDLQPFGTINLFHEGVVDKIWNLLKDKQCT